jgi:hypothetical protein
MEHSHRTIRSDDTLFEFERRALLKRGIDGGPRGVSIVGVDTFEIAFECGRELIRGHPEDPAQLLRSLDSIAVHVPLVAPKEGDPLSFCELGATPADFLVSLFTVGDVETDTERPPGHQDGWHS